MTESAGLWIIRNADYASIAREVEAFFAHNFRTDGGPGGGGVFSTQVYAYKKTSFTIP
jgi:hypothetical protein